MFKSVFAKYVTAFMAIITLGFVTLLLIVTSIVSHYSAQAKAEIMEQVVLVMQEQLEQACEDVASDAFSEGLDVDTELEMDRLFSVFTESEKDKLSVWVADRHGHVIYSNATKDELDPFAEEDYLHNDILVSVWEDASYLGTVPFEDRNGTMLIRALRVNNQNAEFCGIIAVGSSNVRWGVMVEELSQTVITSALLVLLATLIAVYFITERTVRPLRKMNRAVQDFAKGKFESRVAVRGKDEVAQLAESFNHMANSLENLEKMRSSFVANVSHDLRTPMTTISGFIDGIRDGVIPPEQVDHYLEVVSLEVHRLSRLVASLLDLSRIQAGERKFVMQAFDICEMGRIILISFEQKIEEKRLQVEFDCDGDRMFVSADHDAIYQVFYNLCHNAVKFAREDGLLRIRISSAKDKKVQVSVYNEGQGISEEDLPQVFERFYKSDKSRGLDKSGTGLGLYISKTIIQAHGERIWANSESGKNCEFCFTLTRTAHQGAHSSENTERQ